MTEAEQSATIAAALSHHRAHCPEILPIVAFLDGKGFHSEQFRCPACCTSILVSFPDGSTWSRDDYHWVEVAWGTIGPPTPQNATNPTASAGA